ncbi:MAG: ATP-binding protein [Dehalococcoidales bacterium]|nr:ATP-binding protein [Dehalococcoidales bacterium]
MPAWFDEWKQKYVSGVAIGFLLHLNISDYVEPGVNLISYLSQALSAYKVIAIYNRAKGITFPLETMRKTFIEYTGLQPDPITGDLVIPKSPKEALPVLEKLLRKQIEGGKASVVIIEYAESLVPAADMAMMIPEDRDALVTIESWARDPGIVAAGNPIFLITNNVSDIHQAVRAASSKYEAIRIPIPNIEERKSFVDKQPQFMVGTTELSNSDIARATAGLSLVHIEDIFLRAKQEGRLTWELIRERKRDIMKSEFGDVLEMMEPRYGFDAVGGLDNVKEFFYRNVINPVKIGNYGRVPMGVLMTGPAGTGKTIMAEAVAKESGLNMAVLNPAKIFSKWVGESERNLDKALEAVKSLAPIIILIDEIDQQLQRGEAGDSGVSNRVFKRLMEFMSDTGHRGQVVFLAATNRPDLMDAALKRPGRFDAKIPFLVPDQKARLDIFRVMCAKYKVPFKLTGKSYSASTEGWTGAEIEKVVIKAKGLMEDRGLKSDKAITEALKLTRARTQNIEMMTRVAIEDCDDLEFIPEKYRNLTKESNKSE